MPTSPTSEPAHLVLEKPLLPALAVNTSPDTLFCDCSAPSSADNATPAAAASPITPESASSPLSPMSPTSPVVDPKRSKLFGTMASIAGEGFTFWEAATPSLMAIFALGFTTFYLIPRHAEWTLAQCFWVYFFSLNVGFGTAVSTNALKKSYHKSSSSGIGGSDLLFVFLDGILQTTICNFVFLEELGGEWQFALTIGCYLFFSFALCTLAPVYLMRTVNVASFMMLIFLATYVIPHIPGMEWYPYVIFVKYLNHLNPMGHH